MNIDLSRRSFLKLAGAGVAATSLGAMGFGGAEAAELAHVREFKLTQTTETRNTCPIALSPAASSFMAAPTRRASAAWSISRATPTIR